MEQNKGPHHVRGKGRAVSLQKRESFYSELMRKRGDVIFVKGPLTSADGSGLLLAPKSQIACILLEVFPPETQALPVVGADNYIVSLGGWAGPSIGVCLFMWARPIHMWIRRDQLVHEPTGP